MRYYNNPCGVVDAYHKRTDHAEKAFSGNIWQHQENKDRENVFFADNGRKKKTQEPERIGSLIIEEDTVYEVDEICMRNFAPDGRIAK